MKRLAAIAAIVLVTGIAAVPAVGQSSPAVTTAPVCPTIASTTTAVAGYTLSALAAPVHSEVDSPGLLPTGDPVVGEVIGLDAPLARIAVSGGPLVDALSSPVYPGDTAAHLGTILALEKVPGVPNEPVLAEANYPASPDHKGIESFNSSSGSGTVGVATAHSTASELGGTAEASVTSTSLGAGSKPLAGGLSAALSTGASDSNAVTTIAASCVDSTAAAVTSGIDIAGIIHIAGVTGYAAARTDGRTATPLAQLKIGRVSVAGMDAYIDRDGVHLAAQQSVGAGVVASVETALQRALAAAGMTVALVNPHTVVQGGSATADSGAIVVRLKQTIPQIGSPPNGTPPIPTISSVAYGLAQVSVNATAVPAAPDLVPPVTIGSGGGSNLGSTTPTPTAPSPTGSIGPVGTPAPQPFAAPLPGGGSRVLAANSGPPPPAGSSVPIGWVIIGVVASIVAVGPLLGYARWQLLDGRI